MNKTITIIASGWLVVTVLTVRITVAGVREMFRG